MSTTIGEKIKKIRELKGYPQKFMADKLNMTPAGYGKIERGETDIAYSKVEEIAKVLEVSTEDLIAFDQQKFFNSQSNVKGNNNGIIINDTSKDVKKLYEDKIALLERVLKMTEGHLSRYQDKFGEI
jgi:transcriptional regulator with XRE-family HTH domain